MDIFEIPVHPAAEVFPMLDEEELEELAQDIKANGLQQLLVIDELNGDPVLVDGRNRREAYRRAGVVPDYILLDGQDPIVYILSANINRRHLSKGQRAIVIARILERNHISQRKAADSLGIKQPMLAKASTVLRYAPDLADQVLTGSVGLNEACEEARIRKG
jgi:ParB-like chromosome segregation protein Spo0J